MFIPFPFPFRRKSEEMAATPLRPSTSLPKFLTETLIPPLLRRIPASLSLPSLRRRGIHGAAAASADRTLAFAVKPLPTAGAEEALMGFITGKRRATEVAHSVWKSIVRKGDTVIDATCGNGHDTLALLKMVVDESGKGCVYGMDIQNAALENTSYLLEESVGESERRQVKLFSLCHSNMEAVIPKDTPVRLVAFNLGYLPGGDKTIVTTSSTTLLALQASSRILDPGGLISVVVYVGHPGGRDELETVKSFASGLPMETWSSSKFELLNRETCPVLIFLFKK